MGIQVASFDDFEAISEVETKLVEVPELGRGRGVMIRRMSREQYLSVREGAIVNGKIDQKRWETHMLVNGVAAPEFSVERAEQLMRSPATSSAIGRIIGEISLFNKTTEEAQAEAEESFPDEPGQGAGDLAGAGDGANQDGAAQAD